MKILAQNNKFVGFTSWDFEGFFVLWTQSAKNFPALGASAQSTIASCSELTGYACPTPTLQDGLKLCPFVPSSGLTNFAVWFPFG